MRERMFLVAIAKPLAKQVVFPKPTHWIDLPKGYSDTRKVALQTVNSSEKTHFVPFDSQIKGRLKPAITAKDALNDLPILDSHLIGDVSRAPRRDRDPLKYRRVTPSAYGEIMRGWKSGGAEAVSDHVIRLQPRDFPIFRMMKPGDEYPQAHALAEQLLHKKLADFALKHGKAPSKNSKLYKEFEKQTVPPYDVSKFPNKWRKMEAGAPARTLMAHLGKDCYSHIHYDSLQARTISIREAARLQSFPDQFKFSGPMGAAFRQIGNAVPPLLAKAIGHCLFKTLVDRA